MFDPTKDLERIKSSENQGLAGRIGIEITEVGVDYIKGTMPVDERTHQPFGLLHGGASVVLAETLGSLASFLLIKDPTAYQAVGLEINANHLRGVKSGIVTGTCTAVHTGKQTQVWSILIQNEDGKNVCISRITIMIVKL